MQIVLGPPGTGKTTKLLGIVQDELAAGTEPETIGYISFTRKAADEAASRAREKFGFPPTRMPWFRTLHSLCFRMLGLSRRDVLEGEKLAEFGTHIGMVVTGKIRMDEGAVYGGEEADKALFIENLARTTKQALRQVYMEGGYDVPWNKVEYVAKSLREFKTNRGLVDYTDMLADFAAERRRPPLKVLLVDEGQDLSLLQWDVVTLLAEGARRVVVAGDDDQAIYRWAGAAVDHFVGMPGQVEVLKQSYRVPRAVQDVSREVISAVRQRREKEWMPRAEQGAVVRAQRIEDVDLSGKDVLILARNRYLLRGQVEPLLRSDGVLYDNMGYLSVRSTVMDAVQNWELLRRGEKLSRKEIQRVYDQMSSGKGVSRGHKTLPGVDDEALLGLTELRSKHGLLTEAIWHEALDRLPADEVGYLLRARQKGESTKHPRIKLSTIHGAKGGQADHVVVLRDLAYRTHQDAQRLPEDEARVWYVAVTRARQQLTIVAPRTRLHYSL